MPYTLLPLRYSDASGVHVLTEQNSLQTDGIVSAALSLSDVCGGCRKITVAWTNCSAEPLVFQPEIQVRADFAYEKYLIPSVMVNGNHWGQGLEPKGLLHDGEPWVFDYRRTTLPACTLSESADDFLALMASDEDESSLQASCSMIDDSGYMIHRLLYPLIERPLTYYSRDKYTGPTESFVTLAPGRTFTTNAYLFSGKPAIRNYAIAQVEDIAINLMGKSYAPKYSLEEVRSFALSHARALLTEVNGRRLVTIGKIPEGGQFRKRIGYEFGWCGQNGMYARMMIQEALRSGDRELLESALDILDAWACDAHYSTGLVHVQYAGWLEGREPIVDTCNLSYVIREMLLSYQLLREAGILRPLYLDTARGVADFLIAHWSDETGFGKSWNAETGVAIDGNGTIGAFVIPGLVDVYLETMDTLYWNWAVKAMRFYCRRDLDHFACTAGALDTYCIDKETSGPLLIAAVQMYKVDKRQEWLDEALKAGWYFCSWMMHYDTIADPDSDFVRFGYRTLGGTTVSTQHHHLDPWGALIVPELLDLWKWTGDERWHKRAQMIWANAIQNINPEEGTVVHGLPRHRGAQNEAYYQCHWYVRWYDNIAPMSPGSFNDWLVSWPQAFCMNAALRISDEDVILTK